MTASCRTLNEASSVIPEVSEGTLLWSYLCGGNTWNHDHCSGNSSDSASAIIQPELERLRREQKK
eukprot:CAMPEP_0194765316 /NCGR_PEP_ID=MMETSP0323_2-20130528/25992_1 /TAXON_ID=2866 ORGANISM="Crypthecodinium cohnii, Strain Seligo" /NCGR_SAMPLE_ID=MMETSP0323_2 /ASSEMBLY_ACC=CAM_ASM_000346 /LENGTH=64 /DNA_ID=CAMNT_0039694513 /DNA_START=621 /DNA_END=812 /DNA_ORIENTATION=+